MTHGRNGSPHRRPPEDEVRLLETSKASHRQHRCSCKSTLRRLKLNRYRPDCRISRIKSDQAERNNQAWKATVTKDLKAFREEVKHEVHGLEQKYASSLTAALSKTESKLESSMQSAIAQLQTFLTQQNKSTKRASPASPEKSDAEMEPAAKP